MRLRHSPLPHNDNPSAPGFATACQFMHQLLSRRDFEIAPKYCTAHIFFRYRALRKSEKEIDANTGALCPFIG
jgi:hypothetical protein